MSLPLYRLRAFVPHRLTTLMLGTLAMALLLDAGAAAQPVTQPFTFSIVPHQLPHFRHGTVAWGDYDEDGDLDALITGEAETGLVSRLYRNDGKQPTAGAPADDSTATFTMVDMNLSGLAYSRATWGDYDSDGDLDFVVQGSLTTTPPYLPATRLFRNDGGAFAEVADAGLAPLHSGAAAWGDYDNDGDLDLLLLGADENGERVTQLYRNDTGSGSGTAFTAVDDAFIDFAYGDAKWGDYDGDGDLDLLLAGASPLGLAARVYRNDNGSFSELTVNLEGVAFASVDWGDYDGDGDLDILLAGGQVTPLIFEGVARLYQNNNGNFSVANVVELAGTFSGSATWGDYDNDGDLDILVIGAERALGSRTARIYRNDGNTFTVATLLVGVVFGTADWGDYDGDGDLDLLAAGLASGGIVTTNLYENKRQLEPAPPGAPVSLRAAVDGGTATLGWETSRATGLTYNLRVGTAPQGTDVVAPQANPATGRRLLARPGNAQQRTEWHLRGLQNGTYYWSVQALDNAFAASPFAAEGTFTVTNATAVNNDAPELLPTDYAVHPNYPNPFSARTTIQYDLPAPASVTLRVYNILGETVATLVDATRGAGVHRVAWDGRNQAGQRVGAGMYFYEMRAGQSRRTGKMMLVH